MRTDAAVVVVGGWFLLISPQRSTASDLHSQAATQEQDNHTLEQRIAALNAQHKDLPTGVALPVEEPAAPVDAGVSAPVIDAGLPQGGVLL